MKFILAVLLYALYLVCASCNHIIEPPKPEDLYAQYEKSVVLVRVETYFELSLNTGITLYFSHLENDEPQNTSLDEEEVISEIKPRYGTGFFVGQNGLIATNRHVVEPLFNESAVLSALKNKVYTFIEYQENRIGENKWEVTELDDFMRSNYQYLSYDEIEDLKLRRQVLIRERIQYAEIITKLDFNPAKSAIRVKYAYIGVAYNNTYTQRKADFKECVLKKISPDADIDLAILQLKDKMTPHFVEKTFSFEDQNPNKIVNQENDDRYDLQKPLKINTLVYMIGFNYGPSIGNTEDGLKAQLTQGNVSQQSDKKIVLYSIPSLEGSSGSPVIDEWGNLVAINFAKVSGTQSFNYGILAKHLKELMEL
jgi:S1-C subfamily serine protease